MAEVRWGYKEGTYSDREVALQEEWEDLAGTSCYHLVPCTAWGLCRESPPAKGTSLGTASPSWS